MCCSFIKNCIIIKIHFYINTNIDLLHIHTVSHFENILKTLAVHASIYLFSITVPPSSGSLQENSTLLISIRL